MSVSAAPVIPVPVVPASTAITGVAAGSAGQVTISSPNTLASGDIVAISGSTNYDGTYNVLTATPPSFTVAAPFVGPLVSSSATPPVVQPQIVAAPVTGIAPSTAAGQVTVVANNTLTSGAPIVIAGSSIPALNGPNTVIAPTPTSFNITTTFVPPPVPPAGTPVTPGPTLGVILSGGGVVPNCTTTTTGTATAITLPSVATVPSRFTGVAPLAISFDATGTTATATNRPFHDLEYRWNFGESTGPGAGTWSTGSRLGISSRNTATGPVAAHVFETPGTYIVKLTATDGINTASNSCIQIAVTDPDLVFAGANTVCIANNTATAGSGGCPTGAFTPAGTASFNTALAACIGTTKRCLFNRGDTFASSAPGIITVAGPLTIGAYGSGALPLITSTNIAGVIAPGLGASDLRVMDLNIIGSGPSNTGTGVSVTGGSLSNLTFLRLSMSGSAPTSIRNGIIMQSGSSIAGSVIQDNNFSNMGGAVGSGYAIFGWAINSAFLGNNFGPFTANAQHIVRLQPGQRVAISNNTLTTPGNGGEQVLTIRANDHITEQPNADTQYIYISDNKLIGGNTSLQMFQIAPASNNQNDWIYDVIAERNWIVFGSVTQQGLYGEATRLTVRNNICDASASTSGRTCYSNDHTNTAGVPTPDANTFYNNTCYAGSGATSFFCVFLGFSGPGVSITNTTVANNVGYAPTASSPIMITATSGVSGTSGASGTFGNSSNAQVLGTNPNFLNASGLFNTPLDFKLPSSSSYAIGGGTSVPVWSDFFLVAEPSPRDMGAVNH